MNNQSTRARSLQCVIFKHVQVWRFAFTSQQAAFTFHSRNPFLNVIWLKHAVKMCIYCTSYDRHTLEYAHSRKWLCQNISIYCIIVTRTITCSWVFASLSDVMEEHLFLLPPLHLLDSLTFLYYQLRKKLFLRLKVLSSVQHRIHLYYVVTPFWKGQPTTKYIHIFCE